MVDTTHYDHDRKHGSSQVSRDKKGLKIVSSEDLADILPDHSHRRDLLVLLCSTIATEVVSLPEQS